MYYEGVRIELFKQIYKSKNNIHSQHSITYTTFSGYEKKPCCYCLINDIFGFYCSIASAKKAQICY